LLLCEGFQAGPVQENYHVHRDALGFLHLNHLQTICRKLRVKPGQQAEDSPWFRGFRRQPQTRSRSRRDVCSLANCQLCPGVDLADLVNSRLVKYCRSLVFTGDQLNVALVPGYPGGGPGFSSSTFKATDARVRLTPLVPWDPSAFIALVDDANDLLILYYFSKGSRPCAVGYLGLLARWLSCLHRPLSLVAVAGGHSDVEVWDCRLCPCYVFLDFLVIQFRRMGLVVSRLRIRNAFFRSRGHAWLGGVLLNSLALVLTRRPALALPLGWMSWLAIPALVGGLGWSFWCIMLIRLRCSLALAGVEVTWIWVFGAVFMLVLSSLVATSDFLRVSGSCLVLLLFCITFLHT